MDGVVVEQEKTEHVRGDYVDAAVLELGFVNICFILGPMTPSGRRTKSGSSVQYTVPSDTFWRKTMKNHSGTMKNHPGTMKNQPGTIKHHENYEKP